MKTYIKKRFGGKLDGSKNIDFLKILRWQLFIKPRSTPTAVQALEIVDHTSQLVKKEDFICWLSHASFLIQLGGKRILIDPVFGNIPFYKRQIPSPYGPKALGRIDYLLISHTHYDHLDTPSIRQLEALHPQVIVPLQMQHTIRKAAPSLSIHELDWYANYHDNDLSITLVPAKHWGRRGIFDKNRALWGGFILEYRGFTIYFAGDSAVGPHFKEIGERYDIDIALMPIGAYKPEFIMKHNHLNPQEAYDAFKQLGAKKMIPMHYGTFKLSDEPLDEPLQWMQQIAALHTNEILFIKPGEIISVPIA
ncbi:MAG: hypothetical protein DRG24_00140 [Epsilonproteobacteria bacterium]|nr:MAG: hypothetical protein DRG24_00140 [Campylobacterota bacterium]